ncbi:hypothetical protein KAJ41_00410 [Candidatus Parcubacteria bacterium]|nr:hypothetical protein [Candidatus Parcubacteria bacterium]
MKIKKNGSQIIRSGKFWSFMFLLSAILLAVDIFRTKCGNNSFFPTVTTICGTVNIDLIYFAFLFAFFIISLYFSSRNISCVFSSRSKQRKITCSINARDAQTVIMFFLGVFLFLFAIYGYYLNNSICSKSEADVKKEKLFELQNFVELSYENSNYYPYYFSERSYPNSFQDMIDNGTLSKEDVINFELKGFAIKEVDSKEDYFIEANIFQEERRLFCEDIRKKVKTFYCDKSHCVFN